VSAWNAISIRYRQGRLKRPTRRRLSTKVETPLHRVRASVITPPGEGGIGIIAVWGPGAAELLDRVFVGTRRGARDLPVGTIAHGTVQRDGRVLDEVIVARPRPGSPLAEADDGSCFEVNCHGGVVAVYAVLGCIEEAGGHVVPWQEMDAARIKRAPPLDGASLRAAALAALPHAPTRLAVAMLLHQADGALERERGAVAAAVRNADADGALGRLDALLATAPLGRALLDPPTVAILGPPNAGKSTLFNALLDEERAIVHQEPGTTRDVVAQTVAMRGVPFELKDSAGIRQAHSEVERCAVGLARDLAGSCEVALLVFDARRRPRRSLFPPLAPEARTILVGNKVDLLPGPPPPAGTLRGTQIVYVSAREHTNIAGIESALLRPYEPLLEACRAGGPVIFTRRAEQAVARVRRLVAAGDLSAAAAELSPAGS